MTLQIVLLIFSGLLLLIAIIGGGFEVRELKIPKVERTPRILAALGGTIFVLLAFYYDAQKVEEKKTPPAASQPSQPRQVGDVILGTWHQFLFFEEKGHSEPVGTFIVTKDLYDNYAMSSVGQEERPDILNSIGIFEIQSDGTSWKFNSHLVGNQVANFDLKRVSDTVFEGTAKHSVLNIAA
jgi:hypothetical protein